MAGGTDSLRKGARRRQEIIEAAAEIIVAEGPGAVTHRGVAARAGCSLSATTYYFSGIDELLEAAGAHLVGRWAEQAERVRDDHSTTADSAPVGARDSAGDLDAAQARGARRDAAQARGARMADVVGAVLAALLPPDGEVRGHYQQLLMAGASPALARAYQAGRGRLDAAISDLLAQVGSDCPGPLAVAVVDGAVVSALSEGRDVRKTATDLLRHVV
ncbi:TetR/AcrR family transcriptional regulator [Georgenia yuyongxinii]|uniref:TetR family transcriptional regulator n=1 Tax=Georgenia yuyongxinii TaxID=2589797 RepID=A0A552WNU0_9MICO|nr:TetR family transcriptional regulator [Georgenia yuyongxinii]TRW44455.1 TetR family transcriptional regulator [Georgenia yuyongxinii]TRW44774.1 TetR family transcriptional regulator [Georgenia yuyongxinii]